MEKQQYTLMGLLKDYAKVEIPIIQRDYAQGRRNKDTERIRSNFLDAIHAKLAAREPMNLDFVYGDVKNGTFAPLDGQQRLTTLVLLHWYAAKREEVEPEELRPLGKFSYATRVSARKFFEELTGFTPKWGEGDISAQIRDQHWYAARWGNDPTIKSALVMLDAIDKKFADLASPADKRLWLSLTKENLVSFFFLPIDDIGMTDDLYVKMNSRGKPLTEFEHFKAMMESRIKTFDEDAAKRIGKKIDIEWTRTLWQARDTNNTVDNPFVNYILFIANIARHRKGEEPIKDVFDALDVLFDDTADRDHNVRLLESMFDIWCDVGDIQAFFDGLYTRQEYEAGKIRVFTEGSENNPFLMCCNGTNFGLPNQVWLYAVCTYLLNRERIADSDRLRRLRTVNNLINASESAVRAENMKSILSQTDQIVVNGIVEHAPRGFVKTQIDEELAKWEYMDKHPADTPLVYKLEDHHLLRGTIYIVGLDRLSLCDKFYALFDECIDPLLRCRALLAQGNYSQLVNKNLHWWGWPMYRFATATEGRGGEESWLDLFHPSQELRKEELNERTGRILCELLKELDTINNDTLQGVVDRYIEETEAKAQLDWRYYTIRYADNLMKNGNGCYAWKCDSGHEQPYLFFLLTGETFLKIHWVALLHILQTKREERTWLPTWHHSYSGPSKHEIPLVLKGEDGTNRFYIRLRHDGYEVYDPLDGGPGKSLRYERVPQNEDGVDTQDRIEIGLKLIDELLGKC